MSLYLSAKDQKEPMLPMLTGSKDIVPFYGATYWKHEVRIFMELMEGKLNLKWSEKRLKRLNIRKSGNNRVNDGTEKKRNCDACMELKNKVIKGRILIGQPIYLCPYIHLLFTSKVELYMIYLRTWRVGFLRTCTCSILQMFFQPLIFFMAKE